MLSGGAPGAHAGLTNANLKAAVPGVTAVTERVLSSVVVPLIGVAAAALSGGHGVEVGFAFGGLCGGPLLGAGVVSQPAPWWGAGVGGHPLASSSLSGSLGWFGGLPPRQSPLWESCALQERLFVRLPAQDYHAAHMQVANMVLAV